MPSANPEDGTLNLLAVDHIGPFHGYRRLLPDASGFEKEPPELYSTIEHFWQSEKFRGVDEAFRRFLIELPTAREARKAALRHDDKIRPDWERIQNRVMATAIRFKCRESAQVMEALARTAEFDISYPFKDHYWGTDRKGVSVGFYARILQRLQRRVQKGEMRVLITGSPSFTNKFLFMAKLDTFFNRRLPDEVLLTCGKGTDFMAELWALEHHLPAAHFPLRRAQSRSERTKRNSNVIDVASHLVAFQQGQGGQTGELIAMAQAQRIPSRIVRIDDTGKLVRL